MVSSASLCLVRTFRVSPLSRVMAEEDSKCWINQSYPPSFFTAPGSLQHTRHEKGNAFYFPPLQRSTEVELHWIIFICCTYHYLCASIFFLVEPHLAETTHVASGTFVAAIFF